MTAGWATEREATTAVAVERGPVGSLRATMRRPSGLSSVANSVPGLAPHRGHRAGIGIESGIGGIEQGRRGTGDLAGWSRRQRRGHRGQSEPAGQEPAAARPAAASGAGLANPRGRVANYTKSSSSSWCSPGSATPGRRAAAAGIVFGGRPSATSRRGGPRNSSSRAPAEHADLAPRQNPAVRKSPAINGVELPAGDPGAEAAKHGGVLAPVFGLREVSARRRVDRPAVERGGQAGTKEPVSAQRLRWAGTRR